MVFMALDHVFADHGPLLLCFLSVAQLSIPGGSFGALKEAEWGSLIAYFTVSVLPLS